MDEVSAPSSFRNLRGTHPYKQHCPIVPTATVAKPLPHRNFPVVEVPPHSPTQTQTHTALFEPGCAVQMLLSFRFKNPSFFSPKGISPREVWSGLGVLQEGLKLYPLILYRVSDVLGASFMSRVRKSLILTIHYSKLMSRLSQTCQSSKSIGM